MNAIRWLGAAGILGAFALVPAGTAGAQPLTRVNAATLQLPAAAPTRGFATSPLWGGLSFNQPIQVVAPPGENNRLFVVERGGRIMVVRDQGAPAATVFLDLTAEVGDTDVERGLLALAFHPDFADNGYFYVWYTTDTTTAAGTGLHDRLARYQVSADDRHVADPASAQPMITQRDEAPNHNGGDLKFGPDGYLYLSLGDEGASNDSLQNSQRIDKDFFSGIVRLDVDQQPDSLAPNPHPAVHPGTYRVPPDNPFVGATSFNGAGVNPGAVRTEFWAVGLRNPWRMAFDPASGELWAGDVGESAREEVDLIVRGGNYGWAYREGTLAGPLGSPPAGVDFIAPVFDYANTGNSSITGGIVYRDVQTSQIQGMYLFADYGSGEIRSLRRDSSGVVVTPLTTDAGLTSFAVNPRDGYVLVSDLEEGVIKQLAYNSTLTGAPYPETLSATGAFSSLTPVTPQPGLVPYTPIASFWSDHAKKTRWVALQDETSVFGFSAEGNWQLPTGAVWVKQFDLELTRGDPSTSRHVETRFLVKTATGVYGLSYEWNDAQTEATLVPESGASKTFTINEDGVTRTQSWRFPSRSECFACHTPEAGFALSFNTRQLNQPHSYPGGTANQLEALAEAGYLDQAPPDPATLPALVAPTDTSQPLELRARSYLDVNCSQCHQPGGATTGMWDARFRTPLAMTGIINGELTDQAGDAANRVIVPGDVEHSQIFNRISASRGTTRMPPIGTREFDHASEQLIQEWIAALAIEPPPPVARLINLSGRAIVGTGDDVLIPGFFIGGSGPRRMLIRAVGPGLAKFDLTDFIPHPTMTLYSGPTEIGRNTGWNNAANADEIRSTAAAIGAFSLPEGGADSALLVTLNPGAYTTHISDTGGESGIALFEVYDADSGTGSRLINASVRAQVGEGAGVIIPGLVIGPGTEKTVLIRAVGPGLQRFDLTNYQSKPVLTLYQGSEPLQTNAGWSDADNAADIASASAAVGAFTLTSGSDDAAILTTLSSGAYTLHVSSGDNSGGVALVEVYEVP